MRSVSVQLEKASPAGSVPTEYGSEMKMVPAARPSMSPELEISFRLNPESSFRDTVFYRLSD
jgi:hypothetical protein